MLKRKINIVDFLFFVTVACCITGFLFAKAEKTPLNKIIKGKENIAIEILLPDVHSPNNNFFKEGDKAAITIRNRPYTKLTIIKTEYKPKLITIPVLNGTVKTIEDPARKNTKDYFVTLSDTALKTSDSYVIGGNKIKAGNQIELEGFNYRLTGKVINVYPIK